MVMHQRTHARTHARARAVGIVHYCVLRALLGGSRSVRWTFVVTQALKIGRKQMAVIRKIFSECDIDGDEFVGVEDIARRVSV